MIDIYSTAPTYIDGVGPKRAEALKASHGIATIADLLRFFPRQYMDRHLVTQAANLNEEESATFLGSVRSISKSSTSKGKILKAKLEGEYGERVDAVWFHGVDKLRYAIGNPDQLAVAGEPEEFRGHMSFTHPDFFKLEDGEIDSIHHDRIVPFYPGGQKMEDAGLSQRRMRQTIWNLLSELGDEDLPQTLPQRIAKEYELMDVPTAVRAVHFPFDEKELNAAKKTLKFEELYLLQVLMQGMQLRRGEAPELGPGDYWGMFRDNLPFDLTGAQKRVVNEIQDDLQSGRQMGRLLQGDVGSGKTVVAVDTMLKAIDEGKQAAFMAPTSILAEQHLRTLREYLTPLGITPVLITGDHTRSEREEIEAMIASGEAQAIVGTHALFQDDMEFDDLGVAVIDEQHRFGVRQRQNLFQKGEQAHMLLMTATPIPRSLAMGMYGDLDVSNIDEMPPGRKPVNTQWIDDLPPIGFIDNQVMNGHQVFVVCPMAEHDPTVDMLDIEHVAQDLQSELSGATVDTVHGQMADKPKRMKNFQEGLTDVIVSTTVVEVGVDVPNATGIVVMDADQFGLAQLHQLRGRVGRSDVQSFCFLVTRGDVSDTAAERLETMTETNDGFDIAEKDLELRGTGDLIGTRQSGMSALEMASLQEDEDLLTQAREAAQNTAELSDQTEVVLRARYGDRPIELARIG
jgi:ATP-dependent DNA helicase RecG